MLTKIAVVAVLALAPVSSPLRAQGTPAKHVEISTAAIKSMTSQKPRSKKSMMERAGMKRATTPAGVASASSTKPAPTSVRTLDPKKIR